MINRIVSVFYQIKVNLHSVKNFQGQILYQCFKTALFVV